MPILISIIIPVFNTELYLEECLESVINQSIDEYEIIIVNDGSTDNSSNIADACAQQYSYIKVIHQSNQGVFVARNRGLLEAKGDYVIFLDADDYLLKDSLLYLKRTILYKNYDIIFCKLQLIGNKSFLKIKPYIPNINNEFNITKAMFLDDKALAGYMGGKIIKKSIAEQAALLFIHSNTKLELYEDCFFLFCVSIYCKKAFITDKKMYAYRIHGDSVTQKSIPVSQKLQKLQVAKKYFESLKDISVIKNHPYALQALVRIDRVILSSKYIEKAKNKNYIKNIYKAWLLDSRLVNLIRIIIYVFSFGTIKK